MKHLFTLKAMALAAMMMMTGAAQAAPAKASTGDLVISKVYYAGTKDPNNKNYKADQYLEIMNNKHKVVDVAGLYIGVLETESGTSAYTAEYLASDEAGDLKNKVICKQIFRIPTTTPVYLEPGKTLIITNCAVDHTASNGHDLSAADFEVKTTNSGYSLHNENVAALEMTYSFNATTDFINFTNSGPCGLVLIATAAETQVNAAIAAPIYAKGKEKGSQYVAIPSYRVIDGVDILKKNASTGEVDVTTKRLVNSIDAGYTTTATATLWNGETVYRRTALYSEDRVVLFDTNNSSVEWAASATIQPRAFDTEEYSTTELPITIPASGYLPIKPAKPFFGPKDLTIVSTNASSQATVTDITYNAYRADTLIALASPCILVGTPGSYTLKLSDAAATISGSSNSNWMEEAGVYTATQPNRQVYKFICNEEQVGFQRDENYKEVNYKSCNFAEGEHFFITLPQKTVDNIETNRGMEAGTLSFLEWTGPKPELPITTNAVFDFVNNNMGLPIGDAQHLDDGNLASKSIVMGDVTFTCTDGATATRYFSTNKGNQLQVFKNGTFTLSAAEGKAIKGVAFTFVNTQTGLTADSGTYEAGVWTGNATSVTFSAAGSRYIYVIEVTVGDADDETINGIEGVKANDQQTSLQGIFDLSGRRVSKPVRGLYIIDGKKVVVK